MTGSGEKEDATLYIKNADPCSTARRGKRCTEHLNEKVKGKKNKGNVIIETC